MPAVYSVSHRPTSSMVAQLPELASVALVQTNRAMQRLTISCPFFFH